MDEVSQQYAELATKVRGYLPRKSVSLVESAYLFARTSHEGQMRRSGDPAISHPLSAAHTIADLQLDATTIAAALLHDVQEDCAISNTDITQRFGREVANLVEGVTKLGKISWQAPEERAGDDRIQAENLRKMFLAMADDLRVIIIKLSDRLHNMLTLHALQPSDQARISKETMEIYAPLAARLGIWELKWQLEDMAFRYLQPDQYKTIATLLDAKRETRELYITEVAQLLTKELTSHKVVAEVQGRAKHIYSIYQKMEKYAAEGKSVNEIYDLLAVRILTETVADCYSALGVVHGLWRPLPSMFDDYIANPRESMYQSLHTTVMSVNANPLEVQIRTREMHRTAEYGVAAHWRYKEGSKRDLRYEERLAWLRQLLDWHRELSGAEELVEAVKTDIFQDQVFVFTPKGEIKDLPRGATPIDFAYRIHTDLGHACIGAKINGKLVPLNYRLQNGDAIEILISNPSKGPSRDWLNQHLGYLRTSHARQKVRQWFKRQERAENIDRGREMIEKELSRLGVDLSDVEMKLLEMFDYDGIEDLCLQAGYGEISTSQISAKLAPIVRPEEEKPDITIAARSSAYPANIQVLGTGDLLSRLSRCCNPVPGEKIVGFVTRGDQVTVHRHRCHNIQKERERERLVEVNWGRHGHLYPVAVHINGWDRVGLLRDVSTIVAEEQVNMVGVYTQEQGDNLISIFVTLETTGVEQLSRLMNKLESIKGVVTVSRQLKSAAH